MIAVGIDVGSIWTKAVVLDNEQLRASVIQRTGLRVLAAAEQIMAEVLAKSEASRGDVKNIVATGYGRISIPWATKTVTEITCHARGIHWLIPTARTLIDIGGQDTKVIRLDGNGDVVEFAMSDKCAAGTGRFIEVMAGATGVSLDEIGHLALEATEIAHISSICTIFAESEVISLAARGVPVPNIIAGVFDAISKRTWGLACKIRPMKDYAMSGGVAMNIGVVKALERTIQGELLIPAQPMTVGALGAALIAASL